MSTLSEKLLLTLATKENIKREIEKKGINVGDVPFSDYPSKIASIGNDSDWKEPDWHDIINIRLMDTEDYVYKSIYLLDDTEDIEDTIYLQGGDAYKTSDSDELILEDGHYSFTGEGDLECSKGYKTRWLIVYKNTINNEQPKYLESVLLYTIQDGTNSLTGFSNCYKLNFVDNCLPINEILEGCFQACSDLRLVTNLETVYNIGKYAFRDCYKLSYLKLTNCTINEYAFNGAQIDTLILDNVKCPYSDDSTYKTEKYHFSNSIIKNLFLYNIKDDNNSANPSNIIFDIVGTIHIDDTTDYSVVEFSSRTHCSYSLKTSHDYSKPLSKRCFTKVTNENVNITSTLDNLDNSNILLYKEVIDSIDHAGGSNQINIYDGIPTLRKLTMTGTADNSLQFLHVGSNCIRLKELYFPNSIQLASHVNIPNLEILSYPEATICKHYVKIKNLEKLTELNLPKLTTLKVYELSNLDSLESVNLPNVETLSFGAGNGNGVDVFGYIPKLKELSLPNLTQILGYSSASSYVYKDRLFSNLSSLETLNLLNLNSISSAATSGSSNSCYLLLISNNPNLTTLELPNLTQVLTNYNISGASKDAGFCCYNEKLKTISLPNLEILSGRAFTHLPSIESIHLPKLQKLPSYFLSSSAIKTFVVGKNVSISGVVHAFSESQIQQLIFEDGFNSAYSTLYIWYNMALGCDNLEYIYLPASITLADSTSTATTYHIANLCPKLTTIELGQGYSKTLYLKHLTTLTKECVVNMLNALADLTGLTKQTLYIYSGTLKQLSDEEKAIATNKNWTLAS